MNGINIYHMLHWVLTVQLEHMDHLATRTTFMNTKANFCYDT